MSIIFAFCIDIFINIMYNHYVTQKSKSLKEESSCFLEEKKTLTQTVTLTIQ